MAKAKITLTGLYNFTDGAIFDDANFPADLDRKILINQILMQCGEFEVLYADPEFLRGAIAQWAAVWYRTFYKWIEALKIEYDPLYNYDRYESWTDEGTGSQSSSYKDRSDSDATTESRVSAYNSSTYQPSGKTINDGGSSSEGSGSSESAGVSKHTGHLYGNIGVTTSQQMLKDELDIARFSIYESIANMFMSEFTIPVYE